ncbi:MAG: hypothetical protein QXX95_02460 [Nitrososphaerales archaeon]
MIVPEVLRVLSSEEECAALLSKVDGRKGWTVHTADLTTLAGGAGIAATGGTCVKVAARPLTIKLEPYFTSLF